MHEFIEDTGFLKLKQLFFVCNPVKLCRLSYPGHPKGCPNIIKNYNSSVPGYKKNIKCPPFILKLDEKYNLKLDKYFVYVKFNIKKQKEKMKLLYWQKSVVKRLKEKCNNFLITFGSTGKDKNGKYYTETGKEKHLYFELIPEAMGLHVFETAAYHGLILEKNPENYIYKIAFIGVLK